MPAAVDVGDRLGVLGVARLRHTLAAGWVTSKTEAAAFASATYDARWRRIVGQALRIRIGGAPVVPQPVAPPRRPGRLHDRRAARLTAQRLAVPGDDPATLDIVTMAPTADLRRLARWAMLLCTLVGLAAMHTLGHTRGHIDAHHHGTAVLTVTHADAAAAPITAAGVAAVSGQCAVDTCGHHPGHGGTSGWTVCLAVLSGLAVAVLLAASLLLGAPRRRTGTAVERDDDLGRPRPPPRRRPGSIVASVSVLRI